MVNADQEFSSSSACSGYGTTKLGIGGFATLWTVLERAVGTVYGCVCVYRVCMDVEMQDSAPFREHWKNRELLTEPEVLVLE